MGWAEDEDEAAGGGPVIAPSGLGRPPDNEVPAVLAIEKVLGATEDVAFFLAGMRVYSTGVEFEVEARLRPGARIGDEDRIWEVLSGHRSRERVLLGVEFADGRRGSNLGAGEVRLCSTRSGGSTGSAEATYFCAPLPPPGELRFYCALPVAGIAETVTVLDAGLILEAAGRVRELWPWEPERPERHRPAPPAVPGGGWFAALGERDED